jgi:hypothetical protein
MAIEELPIFCYYDKQRFTQFGAMDCANWYGIAVQSAKKQQALYPAMGRKHIVNPITKQNVFIFDAEPRLVFKTINYMYVVIGSIVYQYDRFYNRKPIGNVASAGDLWWATLPVDTIVYTALTDGQNIYIITENGTSVTMAAVTDPNAPGGANTGGRPLYVAAFGNRFVVSVGNTPNYYLSAVNLGGSVLDLNTCWTVNNSPLFNRASGVINQFCVLHNQLYIMCDFTTDIWANIATQFTVAGVTREFPWKLNSSYNWDYGIADPKSLSVDFGRMVWLAKNSNGLVSFMASSGQQPEDISSQAINVLLEKGLSNDELSPFLANSTDGFLYQYENTVFYRVSAGKFLDFGILDIQNSANSLEYNFETKTWHRVIELNGERNRIQQHVYFNNTHIVTVQGDFALYEMAGNIYHNELLNPDRESDQAVNAFLKYPMRYELNTKQIFLPDYAEFIDDWLEIDFVFGDQTFYRSSAPFLNTVFVVDESSTPDSPVYLTTEDGAFIITEGSNTPTFDDNHYNALFKPHIELYYSDDGGVTFLPADLREFSPLGQYRWRMRWYELSVSRNRCYKLVCVSSAPIVILGGIRNTRRVSGGAY